MSVTRIEPSRAVVRPIPRHGAPSLDNWIPEPIGPAFDAVGNGRIVLLEGRLAGRDFVFRALSEPNAARTELTENDEPVAQAMVELQPGRNVFWDLGVRPALRRGGLATVLASLTFRWLVAERKPARYAIRMVRSLNAGAHATEVQNAGMTVIAHKLGFTPDSTAERLVAPGNITRAEVLEARNGNPPGLLLLLKTAPLAVVCLALEPESLHPIQSTHVYVHLVNRPDALREWIDKDALAITDGDYSLRAAGRETFVRRLAANPIQANEFAQAIITD
jgi:hypothetical protein